MEVKIDREKVVNVALLRHPSATHDLPPQTCPLLLRVFTKLGTHHSAEDFAVAGEVRDTSSLSLEERREQERREMREERREKREERRDVETYFYFSC